MMRFVPFLFLLITTSSQAQNPLIGFVDTANVRASMNYRGALFQNNGAGYIVPKQGSVGAIYAVNFWLGGYMNDTLFLSAETFDQGFGDYDYNFGPIANDYSAPAFADKYKRVWEIDELQINEFIANFDNPQYEIPEVFLNYPAHGDTLNGEQFYLAPFIDVNDNGIYEPTLGDYPEIRGDQMIYVIINDDTPNSGPGEPLKAEIHIQMYGFEPEGGNMDNSVFVNYTIYNRSPRNYTELYLGNWTDFDLGNYDDDYIGSDTSYSMFYVYNGDDFDDDGYLDKLPAIGAIYLNNDLSSFVYYNRDTTVMGDPVVDTDFYNYLTGYWKDGTPMTYGDTGYGGQVNTRFMFSGDPVMEVGWNEKTEGNTPADRRGVGGVGPFDFNAGSKICFDVAFAWAQGSAGSGASGGIIALRKSALIIRNKYENFGYGCPPIPVEIADFQIFDPVVCQGDPVRFNNISQTDPVTARWSFPGGTPSSFVGLTPPPISYSSVGSYDVHLEVDFESGRTRERSYANAVQVTPASTYMGSSNWVQFGDCSLDSLWGQFQINPSSPNDYAVWFLNGFPRDTVQENFTIEQGPDLMEGTYHLETYSGSECIFPRTQSFMAFSPTLESQPVFDSLRLVDSTLVVYPDGMKYQWKQDDENIGGITFQNSFTPFDSAWYWVEVLHPESNCALYSDSILFKGVVIGVQEWDRTSSFALYPNPGDHVIITPNPDWVRMVNSLGQLVFEGTLIQMNAKLPEMEEGIYQIHWRNDDGIWYNQSWVFERKAR